MDEAEYQYRQKNVEIYIDGSEYVEYDHNLGAEVIRRPATQTELEAFGEPEAVCENCGAPCEYDSDVCLCKKCLAASEQES